MAGAPLDVKFKDKSNPLREKGFPFILKEQNNPHKHPWDVYIDPVTSSEIWVIGREAHCCFKKDLVYDEGIVLYCKPEHQKDLVKRISRLGSF